MASQNGPITWRTDKERKDRIEDFQERRGFDNRTKALDRLVDVGLREQQNPLVWRFKDRVIEWINLLVVSGVIVFALGITTDVLTMRQGLAASLVMILVAVMFMASFELTRVATGTNEIGAKVRDVFGRGRA